MEADLSTLWDAMEADKSTSLIELLLSPALRFKYLVFEIELKFGTTEMEARIKWEEKASRQNLLAYRHAILTASQGETR